MQDILIESLSRLKRNHVRRMRMIAILLVLSLVVSLDVFWTLRQPGLTLAGDADCRITEHTHDDVCQNGDSPCAFVEHIHTIACYSDETADVENQLEWQKLFANYPYSENLRENLVGIAKTQVGYRESTANFQVDDNGHRHGYTRYGAWYGAPYNDWSAIFVSFCLHYAGADPEKFPGNTGAASMAELWKALDRYADAGAYNPVPGDLVFFADNTVGIVAQTLGATMYVIRGDVDDAVRGDAIPIADASIVGWGLMEAPAETPAQGAKTWTDKELLDISNGPAFFIIEAVESLPKTQQYMLWSARATKDLQEYLDENGSYYFVLLDSNNHELPKDANGNYIVAPDVEYKLTISFSSPEGFASGTYQYQVPNGPMVNGGNGIFKLADDIVGSWNVTDEGLITLEFNKEMDSRTNVTISATMGIHFPEQEEPIDFDGKITVTVKKPEDEVSVTKVQKWGSQGNPAATDKNDPTKIYWTLQIAGHEDSNIPGSVITDQMTLHDWSYSHKYTQSDIDAGLHFGASVLDPETGKEIYWHRWVIYAGDPNLTWDENGWTYQMPERVTCWYCHNEVVLGNEHWNYYIDYTTTPDHVDIAGGLAYANKVEVDNQTEEGWAKFTHTHVNASVNKRGTYVSDASGARFLWELQVTIPGKKEDVLTDQVWYIHDTMRIVNEWNVEQESVVNTIAEGTVTANYYGTTITVPHIYEATENDPYAWVVDWESNPVGDGYGLISIRFLYRCECTEENCRNWSGSGCYKYGEWQGSNYVEYDHCHCWLEKEDTTFTFFYETPAEDIVANHGNTANQIVNWVSLNNLTQGWDKWANIAEGGVTLPIYSVLNKTVDPKDNSDIVHYNITVNESKQVLTDGSELLIHDVMTDTLFFMSGSLVIKTEDADGNVATLAQGVDYTVRFYGDGDSDCDDAGHSHEHEGSHNHVLDIVILHPQPVKYILDYDTTFYVTEYVPGGIKYTNSATITLWEQDITVNTTEKIHANVSIAADTYRVELQKTAADTGKPQQGANFGLYNQRGGLITDADTDEDGKIIFQTNVLEGIILREHIAYYIQERTAPPGYRRDDTQYWICFCSKTSATCATCDEVLAGTNGVRISSDNATKVYVVNEPMYYNLPATGGAGTYPLLLASVMLIITPLVYMFILRRKRERRGVG